MSCAVFMIAASLLVSLLPRGARIIETQPLPGSVRPDRLIVLWVQSPEERPRPCPAVEDWAPSCPDQTRGCHFHGPTRVSLIDTKSMRIINTITIANAFTGEDFFDIPFKVLTPGPYPFSANSRRPRLLSLRDLNGDGKALEFPLFEAESCSDLFSALFGYSEKRDLLIQYDVHVSVQRRGAKTRELVTRWPEHLFNRTPVHPGFWRFELRFPGDPREVPKEEWTVRYRADLEQFEATCVESFEP